MKIFNLVQLSFSEEEVKEALIMLIELRRNDLPAHEPEFQKLDKLIEHLKVNGGMIDCHDNEYTLCVDGTLSEEEVKVL